MSEPKTLKRGPGRPKGSGRGVRLSEEHRSKIKSAQLLNALQEHALGKREMGPTQIQAAQILLRKALPDLSSIDVNASVDGGLVIEIVKPGESGS